MQDNFVFLVGVRRNDQGVGIDSLKLTELLSFSCKLPNEMVLLCDAIYNQGVLNLQLQVPHPSLL